MDYGQSKSTPSGQPTDAFFTSGVGTTQESNNNYESENNLDLNSSGAATWGQTPERDSRKIGSEVITSSLETDAIPNPEAQDSAPNQMINPDMPPGYPEITEIPTAEKENEPKSDTILDFSTIKERNNFISKGTLETTEKAVHKFKSGEITPADLNDLKWEATNAYLENSFGRKLGNG